MVKPISKATTPQEFPHQHFRLRVFSIYRSHAPVPLFRSQFVHSGMGECFSLSNLVFQVVLVLSVPQLLHGPIKVAL
jgi:hypothetical protein